MANVVSVKDGRTWNVERFGETNQIRSLSRDYIVQLDQGAPLSENGEVLTFTGIPAIGSAHPHHPGLVVKSYGFKEGTGAAKHTVTVTVNYERPDGESETTGSGQEQQTIAIEQWGWDAATGEKELTEAVDGTPVINSAGDPFDTVPKVAVPTPTFTKVIKSKTRMSGAQAFNCKVNDAAVTIGDMSCAIGTLLCTVAESRIFRDPDGWKYRYTIQLKYKSNPVRIGGDAAAQATEIGWDAAVVDTGMREWKDGKKVLIRIISSETGKMAAVSSPALLDGSGKAHVAQSQTQTVTPYIFRFQAYTRASLPGWFYSEAEDEPEPEPEDD